MMKFLRQIALCGFVGLATMGSFGCGKPEAATGDKMAGDKMAGDKMAGDKMKDDKMEEKK